MKQKQWFAVGVTAVVVAGTIFGASTRTADAQADQYERFLGGVKLNSKAGNVLKAYGNPNDVVIGDVGFRESPAGGGAPGQAGGGAAGVGGARGGAPASLGAVSPGGGRGALGRAGGPPAGVGGLPAGVGGPPAGFGGPPAGFGGPPAGFGGAGRGDDEGGGAPAGFGGFGGAGAGFGGAAGGGVGTFGATQSNASPQQETTWIYNRRAGKDVISYEFLIGTGGTVSQIRAIGYAGGNIKTSKGVQLGSTYKNVVLKYGVPEEQFRVGRSLIASYRNKNHVVFQFLNQRGQQENPFSAGNKVIAITIATIE